jgi:hypothetical protein
MFGFFVQESPAMLGTLLVVRFCYVSSLCYQVAPCCSDQGVDLGQHVWALDKYMADDVGKLSLKILSPCYKIYFFIFQHAQGLRVYTSSSDDYTASVHWIFLS